MALDTLRVPHQMRPHLVACQVAIGGIVAELRSVVGEVGQRVVVADYNGREKLDTGKAGIKGTIPAMRKRYTNQFKAQVVQEILKEEKTLNQLAAEHGVHPNQLKRWKTIALEGLPSLFSKDDQAAQAAAAAHEQPVNEL